MNFGRRRPPPSSAGASVGRRVVWFLLAAGIVLILMREVRKPERWRFFTMLDGQSRPRQAGNVDTRLRPPGDAAEPVVNGPPAAGQVVGESKTQRAAQLDLAQIKDDTYFRPGEHDAWFRLLELARDEAAIQATPVTFLELFEQPTAYRGRFVSMSGTVRLVERKPAPKNDAGMNGYYQVWLQPRDQPSSLVVAYCLQLPDGFPRAGRMQEPATISGYFFKRWAYRAQDTIRTAPLLLANTIEWRPRTATMSKDEGYDVLIPAIACVLVAGGIVVWLIATRQREPGKYQQYVRDDTRLDEASISASESPRDDPLHPLSAEDLP